MGGEALQLLRMLHLKDKATMSKLFREERKFHFIREIICNESYRDLLFAIDSVGFHFFVYETG